MFTIISTILAAFAVVACLWLRLQILNWRRNYNKALVAGFPVFYSPIHISSVWWMLLYPVLMPTLQLLPSSWTEPWLLIAQVWKIWKLGYKPFEEAGCDTFILATPSGNMLWSCDNTLIHDAFKQHPHVDAPVEFLKFWDVWGPTIASVQGDEWKAHRKAVTTGFGPSMNRVVWKETKHQTKSLAELWIREHDSIIPVVRQWTSKLALHIISSGFFGLRVEWTGDSTTNLPHGHELTLDRALLKFVEGLSTFFMVPRMLLSKMPLRRFKDAHISFTETTQYLEAFRAGVLSNIEVISKKADKTILEAVVLSESNLDLTGRVQLSKESVMGNIFFTLLAGHETTGGSLGFIFLMMAIYPECQQRVQKALDDQLGSRPMSDWTLEKDFSALHDGYVGAVQKEVLYIFNPAAFIMRKALSSVRLVDSSGQSHQIPENTLVLVNNAAAARSPKNWQKPKYPEARVTSLSNSPALFFNPERWLDTAHGHIIPKRDNRESAEWTAFGAGGRSCPGKMFAQVEMTAAMMSLFKNYTLELSIAEPILRACKGDKNLAREITQDKALKMLYDDMEANITIGIYKEIPIRIIERVV